MKILCVIDSLGSGGAQRQLVNLAISFKNLGHNVSFLVYHTDNFYSQELQRNNIPIIEVIEPIILKRILCIRNIIRKGGYDSVLSFLETPSFICELASIPRKNWKLVVGERSANPKIKTSTKLRAYRFFHFFADAVVANSHANVSIIKKVNPLLPQSKYHVIYNIIDFEKWKPNKTSNNKNNKIRLIIAARHNRLKNLNGLIEAINLLSTSKKDKLIVEWYGRKDEDGSYDKALEKIEAYNLNHIFKFCPPTVDIHTKVNNADIVGLFSFYEGLPNTICEGMINEKLVIASNVSDVPKLIDKKFIFDPNDHTEISKVLSIALDLSKAERDVYARENRKLALKVFNKEDIVYKYLKLLS